ncbi:hypothetical protein O181_001760 [Austropuccinia psidii MF-1]|uniref:Integrase catalytic domain-containing protein n=1 Tax=Austropuccinia psidii MF-1 TaxID=1389203 RepID=A0A9Q3BBP0_9BASI|nr:hypothetical protein [Austropuccinia psidii MF-1]
MLVTKLAFSTAYHPQIDGLAERMIHTMEDIISRFCAYGMEYKDHEGYAHDWVTLLPTGQLAYNISKHSTTGKSPSLVEKGWNLLLPVDHLKKNLLTIHQTAKDFHDMGKRAYDKAAKLIAESKGGQVPLQEVNSHSANIVEVEDSPGPVKKIIKARKMTLNGKDQRQYLVRFESQTADKDKWLAEEAIPDRNLHLRRFKASRRSEKSHQ